MSQKLSFDQVTAALKQMISEDTEYLLPAKSAFWEKISKKSTKAHGNKVRFPIQYVDGRGASPSFNTANDNSRSHEFDEWEMDLKDFPNLYHRFYVDAKLMESTKGGKGWANSEIYNTLEQKIKAGTRNLIQDLSTYTWGTGTGAKGQLAATSSISGSTIVLKNLADLVRFEVGDYIVGSATDGSALYSGRGRITKINRQTKTITIDSAVASAIPSLTDDDFIYTEGAGKNGGSVNKVLAGVPAWIPESDPTSTTFKGVDRTVDVARLSGIRYNGSSDGSFRTAMINMMARMKLFAQNANIDLVAMNPLDMAVFLNEIEATVERSQGDLNASKAIPKGIDVHLTDTPVRIMSDPYIPQGKAWFLDCSVWEYAHIGDIIILDDTGNGGLLKQSETSDQYYGILKSYGELFCRAPGYNGVLTLPV